MINKSNKKGATVLSIVFAVVIMLIITSTIVFSATKNLAAQTLDNMYNDIRLLKGKIDTYYMKYSALPLKEKCTTYSGIPNSVLNPNDASNEYYFINLNMLGNLSLQSKNAQTNFIINTQSHTIYYLSGITIDGKTYYSLPEKYVQINLP